MKNTKLGACTLRPDSDQKIKLPSSFKEGNSYVYETTTWFTKVIVYPDYSDQTSFYEFTEKQFHERFEKN